MIVSVCIHYVEKRKSAFKNNICDIKKFSVSRKMDTRMASRIITKDSAADPEIELYVLVRGLLER